ncbi:HAD-IA family hydrolase [Bradyrhizobium sp.]|uniref:HAD-IA family hydrolase n=1 Tax=Bradyrhizobium sp. TaxID=376 RepID=UPI00272119F8|nr:HAD-IA family hydrolase [Bradyrhizobium sp.]MDO9297354.1 HAD-IA family hydrolase [Bradyrhizobium sp.]
MKKTRRDKDPFDLVIFDCDGVLVDSEVISCAAHAETLTRHGYKITADQVFDRFLGRSMRQASLEVEAEMGRSLPDDFHAQVYAEIFRLFAVSLQATPHVDEALAAIALPVCVASSGPPEKISASLNRVGLWDRFAPHIFSAVQVRNGKPAPDLFLFAAAQMQAAPARCLVIEDSLAGIAAAVAAGMPVLGFYGGSHCRPGHGDRLRAAGAVAVFADMRQLPDLIARIGQKPGFVAGFSAL